MLIHPKIRLLGPLYRFAYVVLRPFLGALTRVHFKDEEELPGEGFILAQNHLSYMDPLVVAYQLGIRGYEVRFLAKAELFKIPVLGALLTRWGMVPVDRRAGKGKDSLIAAESTLESGGVIAVYPEGTITKDPAFWPMKMKTGIARLALQSGKPIIPIVQWGTQDMLDRSSLRLRLKRTDILMRALPAVDLSDLNQDPEDREAVHTAMQRISEQITRGVADLRAEKAPDDNWDPKETPIPGDAWGSFSKWRRELAKKTRRQDVLPSRLTKTK